VARVDELRRAVSAIDAVASNSGRVVIISGEAGIGKTRLMQEVAVLAQTRGFLVATGRCYEPAGTAPYSPFRQALGALLEKTALDGAEMAQWWPQLAALVPEHIQSSGVPPSSGPGETDRVMHAVSGFVQSLTREHAVAILLDDLQWADASSLRLVVHLARQIRDGRLLLVGTYRDAGLARRNPLRAVLGELIRDQLAERIRLHPFLPPQSAGLAETTAGHPLPDRLTEMIHFRTEGNPFFIQQIVHALQDRAGALGLPVESLEYPAEVPDSVQFVTHHRMDRLPEPARAVLYLGSVLGESFDFAELQAVSDEREAELEDALEEVIETGILHEQENDRYQFDHALTRDSIYGELSARRKRRLHGEVALALQRLPEQAREVQGAKIAWHFLQARDPEQALPWTLRAGDDAARIYAHDDAEMQFRKAADLAQELGDEQAGAEALEKLGDLLHRRSRYADAIEPLERAAVVYERRGDQDRFVGVLARLSSAYTLGGRVADGLARVLPVVTALESEHVLDSPTPQAADLYAALGSLYLGGGKLGEALETGDRAVSMAEATGNMRALCLAEIMRGLALGLVNHVPDQRRAFERAAEVAESLGDQWLLVTAVYHHGVASLTLDDFESAERQMRRALDLAERAGFSGSANFTRSALSHLLITRGCWAEARTEAECGVDENRSLAPGPGRCYPPMALGRILLLQGDVELGRQSVLDALAIATQYQHTPEIIRANEILAWQEIRAGYPADAIVRLEPLLDRLRSVGRARYSDTYAWALLDVGDEDGVEEVLQGARQEIAQSLSRARLPGVLLQSARLAMRQTRWTDAVRDLWEGLAVARELGLPYEEALLLHEYGVTHEARGEIEQARMRLEESLVIFRRLGAGPDIERAEQAVARTRRSAGTIRREKRELRRAPSRTGEEPA
jgi:tetratricopeptide (TPR) repeat protein